MYDAQVAGAGSPEEAPTGASKEKSNRDIGIEGKSDSGSEGLVVRVEPLGLAEEISRRMVETRVVDGTLRLDADPSWAGAINTVLVKKGVRVSELRPTRTSSETRLTV
jgi:hypothetical protein